MSENRRVPAGRGRGLTGRRNGRGYSQKYRPNKRVYTPEVIMASSKTKVKTFRLDNDVCEWTERKQPFNKVIKSLYEMDGGALEVSDGEILINGGVHTKEAPMSDSLKDLESMMKCFHASLDDGIRAFQRGLEDGTLTYENGKISCGDSRGTHDLDLRDFYDACEEKRKDPQEVLNRFTRMVWNT